MDRKKLALFGAMCVSATLVACSNTSQSPTSPAPIADAGPSGETLKIAAPAAVSPINGAQPDTGLSLVFNNVNGTYATFPVTYRYEIRTPGGALAASGTQAASGGAATSITVNATLDFDAEYNWRVRAEYDGKVGPWSADARFKAPAGGYIRGNEIFDPLSNGIAAGTVIGAHTFVPGVGLRLDTQASYVAYELPQNLQEGEYSFMATNVDEGNPGDKSKVMSMGEGHVDVTDNDYRQTLEVRGRDYATSPGMISYRIITGDSREEMHRIRDATRVAYTWNRTDWYFFKMWWRTGTAGYEVRHHSPTGPVIASATLATSGHPYRPVPHVVFIGAPNTRAGLVNATHGGMTVKNLWVSSSPRPKFPGE